MNIADRVRLYRVKRGLTQEMLAKKLRVTSRTLRRIEQGGAVSEELAKRLRRALRDPEIQEQPKQRIKKRSRVRVDTGRQSGAASTKQAIQALCRLHDSGEVGDLSFICDVKRLMGCK